MLSDNYRKKDRKKRRQHCKKVCLDELRSLRLAKSQESLDYRFSLINII